MIGKSKRRNKAGQNDGIMVCKKCGKEIVGKHHNGLCDRCYRASVANGTEKAGIGALVIGGIIVVVEQIAKQIKNNAKQS